MKPLLWNYAKADDAVIFSSSHVVYLLDLDSGKPVMPSVGTVSRFSVYILICLKDSYFNYFVRKVNKKLKN